MFQHLPQIVEHGQQVQKEFNNFKERQDKLETSLGGRITTIN